IFFFFFFQAEDGIRDYKVTGVQTCALPICRLRRKCPKSGDGDEHGHLTTGQIGYQCRQTIVLPLRPAVHDRYVLALDEARVLQAPMKSAQLVHPSDRRCAMEKSNYRHRRLLRTRRERPRGRCAGEQGDELVTAAHSITSSACCRNGSGIVRPSAFAVLRLTTSSNLLASCTGRSPGLAPFRMRST